MKQYKIAALGKFREYSTPDNVARVTVPAGIVLTCTAVGALLGMPIAGAVVGGLITNQLKPGKAAEKIVESFNADPPEGGGNQ